MSTQRTTCRECGEELWSPSEIHGTCGHCVARQDAEREDDGAFLFVDDDDPPPGRKVKE